MSAFPSMSASLASPANPANLVTLPLLSALSVQTCPYCYSFTHTNFFCPCYKLLNKLYYRLQLTLFGIPAFGPYQLTALLTVKSSANNFPIKIQLISWQTCHARPTTVWGIPSWLAVWPKIIRVVNSKFQTWIQLLTMHFGMSKWRINLVGRPLSLQPLLRLKPIGTESLYWRKWVARLWFLVGSTVKFFGLTMTFPLLAELFSSVF